MSELLPFERRRIPVDWEDYEHQLAALRNVQAQQNEVLIATGLIDKAKSALTFRFNHDFGNAYVTQSVFASNNSTSDGAIKSEFGICFTITRPNVDGHTPTHSLYSIIGAERQDGTIVPSEREMAEGLYDQSEVELIFEMTEILKLERDLGDLPSLNDHLTEVRGPA